MGHDFRQFYSRADSKTCTELVRRTIPTFQPIQLVATVSAGLLLLERGAMHPFNVGQEYQRSRLLEFVGSRQQQAGVLWGSTEPGCLVVTSGGRHSKTNGYSDQRRPDGCWWYFGQGRTGDHVLTNPANAKLAEGLRSILLFTTREPTASEVKERGNYKKLFVFQGAFNVAGHETIFQEDGTRQGDRLLRFLLVPVDASSLPSNQVQNISGLDLPRVREILVGQIQGAAAPILVTLSVYRQRSDAVRRYALLRAGGQCEACFAPAPFLDEHGNGFLEVHHILRLADDGIDAPANVAAICPNCHRRAHHAVDRAVFRDQLIAAVRVTEAELGRLNSLSAELNATVVKHIIDASNDRT